MNLNNLKKDEILWLYNHYCKHGHRYIEHLTCYEQERDAGDAIIKPEKIGVLDIESVQLNANWGYILCYCIKELGKPIIERVLITKEIRTYKFDKLLIKQFYEDIKDFDRFIVYYGKDRRHDLPFLRSRALFWNENFPKYKEKYITDLYDTVKAKLRLHSNRLAIACDFLGISAKEHPIKQNIWLKAMAGHQPSLDYILLHCREDVISTEKLYYKIIEFSRKSKTSI